MQIFSTSHTRSFSSSRESVTQKGFTLVELLVSIGIIGIVTSIVLVKFGSFDSTVLLKDSAYEIALALREAQVKSVSSVRGSVNFEYPYGMTFDTTSANTKKQYKAFQYGTTSVTRTPRFVEVSPYTAYPTAIGTTVLGRTMQVDSICITVSNTENCTITRLDISFRRPEFAALFFVDGGGYSPSTQPASVQSAKIKVKSPNSGIIFDVIVTQFGQISVKAE